MNRHTAFPILKSFFLLCFSVLSLTLSAQYKTLGFGLGVANYRGDLSPGNSTIDIGRIKPAATVYLRIPHNRFFNTRLAASYGRLEAYDSDSENPSRQARNLSFFTDVWEISLVEEINLIGHKIGSKKFFSPYLFGGVCVYHFNPKTEYLGQIVELQPLGTEGQGLPGFPGPYSLFAVGIPMGGGLKLNLGRDAALCIELGGRKLLNDYIDDVSTLYPDYLTMLANKGPVAAALSYRGGELPGTDPVNPIGAPRGNPKFTDWYYFSTVSIAFILDGDGSPFGMKPRKIPCPEF